MLVRNFCPCELVCLGSGGGVALVSLINLLMKSIIEKLSGIGCSSGTLGSGAGSLVGSGMGGMVVGVGGIRNEIGSVDILGMATVCKAGIFGVRVAVGSLATLGSVAVSIVLVFESSAVPRLIWRFSLGGFTHGST